jgi:hypothetical protein
MLHRRVVPDGEEFPVRSNGGNWHAIQPALTEAIRRQLVGTGASAQQRRDTLLAEAD